MRTYRGIPLAFLLMAGLAPSAWANSELHPGGRLFFPLWDVSTPSRLTFIIITREAMREGASTDRVEDEWQISGDPGKCSPAGLAGAQPTSTGPTWAGRAPTRSSWTMRTSSTTARAA